MLSNLKAEATKNDTCKLTNLIKNRIANKDGMLNFLVHKMYSLRDFTAG